MKQSNSALSDSLKSVFTSGVIIFMIAVSICIYLFVLGSPDNFVDGDPAGHPKEGNVMAIVYKGGVIVPILISCLLIVLAFSIERIFTISRAKGRGNVSAFVNKIRSLLASGSIDQAIVECDKQKGSVANVVKAGLVKYTEVSRDNSLDAEKKVLLIQKDIEETTQLEMPMLEKNLVIIATLASIATLIGLLGTVLGMIKSFSAMATAGAPDPVGLANGISEALINTALGIGTSAVAIVMYNYFTSKIDALTYGIDEAGYSIVQNFTAKNKG